MIECLVDGSEQLSLPADDRGLAYGDGVFETVLCVEGRAVWWDRHLARLERGAAVLGIAVPDETAWQHDRERLLRTAPPRCVLKLILTRGSGGRGYAPPQSTRPRRIVSRHVAPPNGAVCDGLRLRWCATRWSLQPRLAGLKHLNCLDRVLARAELHEADFDEGLMCDVAGQPISAISGNLLVLRQGRWLTPPLDACGVAGICRERLLEHGLIEIAPLRRDEVETAGGLVVCNSVRGILPVIRLGERQWPPNEATRALQHRLAEIEPAFTL